MKQVNRRVAALLVSALGLAAPAASAQSPLAPAPAQAGPRFSVEGAVGPQIDYKGSMQSVAVGFSPARSLTLLLNAERSHIRDEITLYPDGYSASRGGTTQFVSAEVRYAFFASKRVAPYAVIGTGRGTFRQNVSDRFPDAETQDISAFYCGPGVRIRVQRRLDAFVDARLITQTITTGGNRAEGGFFMPLRAGVALRF